MLLKMVSKALLNNDVDNVQQSPPIHVINLFYYRKFCVGQTLCKYVLTNPDTLPILHVFGMEPMSNCFMIFAGAEMMLIGL